jgi:hypothetical protein
VKAILHVWFLPSSSIWGLNILDKNMHPNGFRVYNNIFARLKSQVSHALGRLGRMESILTQHPTTISKLLLHLWMTLERMDLEDPCKSCMLYVLIWDRYIYTYGAKCNLRVWKGKGSFPWLFTCISLDHGCFTKRKPTMKVKLILLDAWFCNALILFIEVLCIDLVFA